MAFALSAWFSGGLRWVKRRPAWLLLGLTVLLVVTVRVRLRDMPLERDEGEYAYAGQLILQGIPPYQDVYNMKLPGTYAAYAVILALFGQTPAAIHLGVLLVNVASILMLFFIGRRLLDETAAAAAAISYGLLSLSPSVLGLAGHATHFVVLFALGGTLLLLRLAGGQSGNQRASGQNPPSNSGVQGGLLGTPQPAPKSPSWFSRPAILVVASGFLFGCAFLMKQHGVFFGLFGGLYLLGVALNQHLDNRRTMRAKPWLRYGREAQSRKPKTQNPKLVADRHQAGSLPSPGLSSASPALLAVFRHPVLFAIGFAVPYCLTSLILWLGGVFPAFWFWTVSYARQYASMVSSEEAGWMFRTMFDVVIGPNLILWLLPLAGFGLMWSERRELPPASRRLPIPSIPNTNFFLATLLLCSVGSVGVGFYFRPHYFITLLPVMSLLTGLAVSRSWRSLHDHRGLELLLAIPVLGLFALGSVVAIAGNGPIWFSLSPEAGVRQIYGTTLFSDAAKAANIVKTNTRPQDRIAVVGSEPEIYFLSHRRSATGYIYTYPLMERHPYAHTMQLQMSAEIETNRPAFAVRVLDNFSWVQRENSDKTIFNWWSGYCRTNLVLVSTLDISGPEEPPTGEKPSNPDPQPPRSLEIYQRR